MKLPPDVAEAIARMPEVFATNTGDTGGWANDTADDGYPDGMRWTISDDPKRDGWNTDCGYNGYGLTKQRAEDIATILNWARSIAAEGSGG
ncbi:MAG: hypothetical protein WC683_16140 [bacterium]